MVFERLDGSFSGIDSMVIRLDKLDCAILLLHEVSDGRSCLIVGDVESWLESFAGEDVEDGLESSNDVTVGCRVDRDSEDVVRIICICNKEKLLALQGTRWKITGAVCVKCPLTFVCECGKAEYFCCVTNGSLCGRALCALMSAGAELESSFCGCRRLGKMVVDELGREKWDVAEETQICCL